MKMKNAKLYLMSLLAAGLTTFGLVSCEEEADGFSPAVTLTSPTQDLLAGRGAVVSVKGKITDDTQISSIEIRLGKEGSATPVATKTVNVTNATSQTINETITVPTGTSVAYGKYVVQLVSKDADGNIGIATTKFDVTGCFPLESCKAAGKVTLLVTVPKETPADAELYAVGPFNGWNPGDAAYKLTKNPNGENCYCAAVPFTDGTIYKFTRGGWETVQKQKGCDEIEQTYKASEGGLVTISVTNWRDTNKCP